jgi:hypothetical protein
MTIKDFIDDIEKKLPDLCTTNDLIKFKLFSSHFEANVRRKKGHPPDFIYFSKRRVVYPKTCVIAWLRNQADKGNPFK